MRTPGITNCCLHALLCLLLITVSFNSQAQRKRGELGALRLNSRTFKAGISTGDSLMLIAYGQNDKRYFRTYSTDGEFVRSSILAGRVTTNKDLLGTLQNEDEFLFFFRASQRSNEIEIITVSKHEKRVDQEEIDLVKGKYRVLTSINSEHRLIVLVDNRKTKELGYISADNQGNIEYSPLKANSEDFYSLLRGNFQLINEANRMDREKGYQLVKSRT